MTPLRSLPISLAVLTFLGGGPAYAAPAPSAPSAAASSPAAVSTLAAPAADDYDPTRALPPIPRRRDAMRTLLWEVKSGDNTVYLFGTIHVGKPDFFPLPYAVESAFRQSRRLVVEADITSTADQEAIGKLLAYPSGGTLTSAISAPLVERLKAQMKRHKLPLDAVMPMKPYMAAGFLALVEYGRLGYDMNAGVDAYLIQQAKRAGKPILELESQLGQIKLLDGMAPNLQEVFLENTLATMEMGRTADQVTGMVNAWQLGNPQLMEDVAADVAKGMRLARTLDDVLLYSRHPAMAAKVEGYLKSGAVHFVAVGSLHLVGKDGLVEMLKARGYEVKQL